MPYRPQALPRKPRAPRAPGSIRNGTIRSSDKIDFTGDYFKRSHAQNPGIYVYFGMWKGPFDSAEEARAAYREWAWEAKH